MGFGTYATIADIKGVLGITSTTDDTIIRKIAEAASRSIDQYTNRRFYVTSETKYFDGAVRLWIPDLLSINASGLTTDEDGDGTFENTFATTDYITYGTGLEDSLNTFPYIRLEISEDSDYSSFASGVKKGVKIIGSWGYGDGISALPYITSNTVTYYALLATGTAVDVANIATSLLSPGQNILIDSEQMYIYSITPDTATVERGVNGTTAATHVISSIIYIYQYPADIRQACIDLSVALYQNRTKRGLQSERLGDYAYTLSKEYITNLLDDSIRSYKRMRV